MTSPFGMYGGFKYQSPTTRALGSINVESYEKVYDDQAQFMSKLAGDVSFLAGMSRKQQAGIDKANENFIQQTQDMINDVIVLLGGGGDTGFDFGDLRYVLIAIGALFGFTDANGKITIPVNLFQAAWHFFSNYIFPVDNFQDVINQIVDTVIATMLDFLGEIPIVGQAAQQVAAIISDIRDVLGPLADAINTFFNAFNITIDDTNGITGLFGPFAPIMDALKTALAGVHLPDFTPMFQAFAQWTAPFVDLIAEVINAFSPMISDLINMGGDVLTPVVDLITPLVAALAPIMDLITEVVDALQPFLDMITAILSMFGAGVGMPSGVDPMAMVGNLFANFVNPSTWAQDLFGLFGGIGGLGTGDASFLTNIVSEIPFLSLIPFLPQIIDALGPILDPILSIFSTFGIGTGGVTDPTALISYLIQNFLNPSGLLEAAASVVMDWAQLGLSLFGISGITDQLGFANIAQNFMSFLGNPNFGGPFNLMDMAQNFLSSVLTPAGALTTQTQLPAHLFGNLAPNNLTNMLPDPSFDKSDYFEGNGIYFWDGTVDHTGKVGSGSARTTANGSVRRLVGVPIGANGGDTITLGAWAYWTGLSASAGNAIALSAKAYDVDGNEIISTLGDLAWIVSPPANSSSYTGAPAQQPPIPAADVKGWVQLTGDYQAPAGTSYVAITIEVRGNVNAGTIWFDDLVYLTRSGFIDAGWIGNLGNFGNIPLEVVNGIQGITSMLDAFQFHIDGLGSAFSGSPVTDLGLPNLFTLAQGLFDFANNAFSLSSANTLTVNNKVNKQATTAGLQPSGESNFSHSDLPNGALPTTTLATGNAIGGWVRIGQNATKGFLDMLMAKTAGTTGIFLNLYKHNTDGSRTKIWPNPGTTTGVDISSSVPDTTVNHAQTLFPGGVPVTPNQVVWAEVVNNSGSNMTVVAKNTALPDHFNTQPKNYGMTRAIAALGVSPTTITDTQVTSSPTAPVMTLGIAVVPLDYHAPESAKFTDGAGDTVYTIPSWVKVGDIIDLTGVGGGGSGQSEWDAGIMAGGIGGAWNGRRLIYGTDIPNGTTQLNLRKGAGGPHPGFYWADGNPGSNTQWWLGPIGTGTLLLDCAGGPGGSNSVGLSSGTGSGPTPNPYQFQGKNYFGGGNVGINATGSNPGGGGGGATWYQLGGSGAPGGGWATLTRPVS